MLRQTNNRISGHGKSCRLPFDLSLSLLQSESFAPAVAAVHKAVLPSRPAPTLQAPGDDWSASWRPG